MEDAGFREKGVRQLLDPLPCGAVLLAAAPKHTPPQAGYVEAEARQCAKIRRHCVVCKEAGDDLPQPVPLLRDGLMHSLPQLCFDLLELGRHAVTSGLPLEPEITPPRLAADEAKAQKVEGLRFAEPALFAGGRRVATELDHADFDPDVARRTVLGHLASVL
jgi:hypothetical protein